LVSVVRTLTTDEPPLIPIHLSVAEAWDIAIKAAGRDAERLTTAVARHFALPVADFGTAGPAALKLVPEKVARRAVVFPLRQDDRTLTVATADPVNATVEDDLAFASGRNIVFEIAAPEVIMDRITEHYGARPDDAPIEIEADLVDAVEVVADVTPEIVGQHEVESAPVIRLTNVILRDAVRLRASDIHIEPSGREATVRFRVDGVMRTHLKIPMAALHRVISRIKIMGKLDIADRLRPQDGRARVMVENRSVELRISTVPTREAEKAVLRVLAQIGAQKLDEIGLQPNDLTALRGLIGHRNGIVVVTGPTGSGKTTTLYAIIREIANGEINVMTVEDPIEYELPGITQMQVEPKRNVTFATALRAILRQDPDVILVGEIRDAETARIAVQASMTGHLVLATLHTNDAVSAVARLVDIGIDRPSIASTVRGVLAQRLLRRVCPDCMTSAPGDEERGRPGFTGPRAVGCNRCGRTGYRGRLPVQEVLVMDSHLIDLVNQAASTADLQRAAAAAGMRSMSDNAMDRVAAGDTTMEEVDRVLGSEAPEPEVGSVVAVVSSAARTEEPTAESRSASSETMEVLERRVLIVDDDPVHRAVARRALEPQGFVVDEAASGAAAIEKVGRGEKYALIVTDLSMPGLGGREVVTCLRAMPQSASLPIIVATSEAEERLEIELMEAGADDYIRKPIDPDRFTARVRAALRRAAARR